MSKFSVTRDWRYINWRDTLQLNLIRSLGVALVYMALMLYDPENMTYGQIMAVPLVYPIFYFMFVLPMGLAFSVLTRMGVPWVGLFSLSLSIIFVLPGDPVVWLFDRATKNRYLPIKDFRLVNFSLILFVIDETRKSAEEGRSRMVAEAGRQTQGSGYKAVPPSGKWASKASGLKGQVDHLKSAARASGLEGRLNELKTPFMEMLVDRLTSPFRVAAVALAGLVAIVAVVMLLQSMPNWGRPTVSAPPVVTASGGNEPSSKVAGAGAGVPDAAWYESVAASCGVEASPGFSPGSTVAQWASQPRPVRQTADGSFCDETEFREDFLASNASTRCALLQIWQRNGIFGPCFSRAEMSYESDDPLFTGEAPALDGNCLSNWNEQQWQELSPALRTNLLELAQQRGISPTCPARTADVPSPQYSPEPIEQPPPVADGPAPRQSQAVAQAPATNPNRQVVAAHLKAAELNWKLGELQKAMEDCDEALKLDPKNSEALEMKQKIERSKKLLGIQ